MEAAGTLRLSSLVDASGFRHLPPLFLSLSMLLRIRQQAEKRSQRTRKLYIGTSERRQSVAALLSVAKERLQVRLDAAGKRLQIVAALQG